MNKLISCNQTLINALILEDRLPERFLTEDYKSLHKKYTEEFPCNKFFFDRTLTVPHYLNVDSERYKIPDPTEFSLNFDEVSEKRAKELLSLGKVINVSWSGGLDSTFTLLTLLNFAEDKSQIKVYGTYNSVVESGNFFDNHINGKVQFDIHTTRSIEKNYPFRKNEIYVTGGMGNDLFYPELIAGNRDSWMIFKDKNADMAKVALEPYEKVLAEPNLEFLQEFIKKSPRKIETLQDLRWWVSFSFNWYNCRTNSYIGIGEERCNSIHPFFGSDDFQKWSMVNTDIPSKTGDFLDERWQIRDKIAEYTGSQQYSTSKRNAASVLSSFGTKWLFLMNDYSNVYLQDL